MKIVWTKPANNSVTIDAYRILINQTNAVFSEELVDCNGASPTIVSQLYCLIPMTTLRAAPYSLTFQNPVQVQIQGHNARGWGLVSSVSTASAQI